MARCMNEPPGQRSEAGGPARRCRIAAGWAEQVLNDQSKKPQSSGHYRGRGRASSIAGCGKKPESPRPDLAARHLRRLVRLNPPVPPESGTSLIRAPRARRGGAPVVSRRTRPTTPGPSAPESLRKTNGRTEVCGAVRGCYFFSSSSLARLASQSRLRDWPLRPSLSILPLIVSPSTLPWYFWVV